MRLLLDENLSGRLIPLPDATYPRTTHVSLIGLERADDREIWEFAKTNDYVIVTKDDDFQDILALSGHPPKMIRLRMGNCANHDVVTALVSNVVAIKGALSTPEIGILDLF